MSHNKPEPGSTPDIHGIKRTIMSLFPKWFDVSKSPMVERIVDHLAKGVRQAYEDLEWAIGPSVSGPDNIHVTVNNKDVRRRIMEAYGLDEFKGRFQDPNTPPPTCKKCGGYALLKTGSITVLNQIKNNSLTFPGTAIQCAKCSNMVASMDEEEADKLWRMANTKWRQCETCGDRFQGASHDKNIDKCRHCVNREFAGRVLLDYSKVINDHNRLVRELDAALNGEEGAAEQASLCDIADEVKWLTVAAKASCCTCKRQKNEDGGAWIYCPVFMAMVAEGDDMDETGETMGCDLHTDRVMA